MTRLEFLESEYQAAIDQVAVAKQTKDEAKIKKAKNAAHVAYADMIDYRANA